MRDESKIFGLMITDRGGFFYGTFPTYPFYTVDPVVGILYAFGEFSDESLSFGCRSMRTIHSIIDVESHEMLQFVSPWKHHYDSY